MDFWACLNSNGAALSSLAAIAIATAIIAIWALVHATLDSKERTRPAVVVEFQPAAGSDTTIDLVVRNAGQSIARDLRLTFTRT